VPHTHSEDRRHPFETPRYTLTNAPAYKAALTRRGDFTRGCTQAMAEWCPAKTEARGRARPYAQAAIETVRCMHQGFHLAWRHTQGFMNSLARALTVALSIADVNGVSARRVGWPGQALSTARAPGRVVMVDATGGYGKDEGHPEKQDVAARPTGRKRHLAIDAPHPVLACELTTPDAGNTMKARALARQKTAAWIRACALNGMTRFGHAGLGKHLKTDGNGGRFGLASINSTTQQRLRYLKTLSFSKSKMVYLIVNEQLQLEYFND